MELQAQLQAQYDQLPSTKRKQAEERQAKIDKLYTETNAAINNMDTTSALKDDLDKVRADLEARYPKLAKKPTPWAQSVVELQAQLQAEYDALPSTQRKRAEERQAKYDALFSEARSAIENRDTSTPFVRHLNQVRADLES